MSKEKIDAIAWELFQGMGTIALDLGEAVQRQAARDSLNAALEAAGYAIVPVKPTEKMLYAAGKTRPGNPNPRGGVDWLGKMLPKYYRAMIQAAKEE